MKSLQSFRDVSISEIEMEHLKGGSAPVSGSFSILGSTFSYSGSVDLTSHSTTSAGVGVYTYNTTAYTSDFCGSVTPDTAYSTPICAQYVNGQWTVAQGY